MKLENCPRTSAIGMTGTKFRDHELAIPFERVVPPLDESFFARVIPASGNDLRALSEKQLIAAAKGGERAAFGELCERSYDKSSVDSPIVRNREDAEMRAQSVSECFRPSQRM